MELWFVIIWVTLLLFILALIYSAGKTNEEYDTYILQKKCFDKHVDSLALVFVKYIGDDRGKIKRNQCILITIDTTDDNKIKVGVDDTYILYDDFEHFNYDWKFEDEDCKI